MAGKKRIRKTENAGNRKRREIATGHKEKEKVEGKTEERNYTRMFQEAGRGTGTERKAENGVKPMEAKKISRWKTSYHMECDEEETDW